MNLDQRINEIDAGFAYPVVFGLGILLGQTGHFVPILAPHCPILAPTHGQNFMREVTGRTERSTTLIKEGWL